MQSAHFRHKGSAQTRREPQAAGKGTPAARDIPGPRTPSAATINGAPQPVKTESVNPGIPNQRVQQLPAPQQQNLVAPPNRAQGLSVPQVPLPQFRPVDVTGPEKPSLKTSMNAPGGTPPTLDSSSTAEHNPPVGFFTARAAETLQKGSALPSNVPVFNPHLESPSIRKTAGVDHTKTKPVRTETIGVTAAAMPRSSFVNPQTDKTRRVGMPVGAPSPLQNRGSYKPPQMKRLAEAITAP